MSWKETHYNTSNYVLVCYLGLISFCIVHLHISITMPRQWLLAHIVNNCDLLLIIVKRHLGVIVITLLRHLLPIFLGWGLVGSFPSSYSSSRNLFKFPRAIVVAHGI
jgi:hypothetical protein